MPEPKPANINLGGTPEERIKALWAILTWVFNDLDGADGKNREDIQRGLLHIAWHESRKLATREQDDDGPARSVFQMQPTRAIDGLEYAKELTDGTTSAFDTLARIGGSNAQGLQKALDALPMDDAGHFPAGNLVGNLLGSDDVFGAYLTRVWFRRRPESFPKRSAYPSTQAWYVAQAEFWFKLWKVSDNDPAKVKAAFVKGCSDCDALFALSTLEVTAFAETINAAAAKCAIGGYKKQHVPPFAVTGEITAFASPDSTWFVLKNRLALAKKRVLIGMYDFTADHVYQELLKLRQKGVEITVMLDLPSGDARAQAIFDGLASMGCTCVHAPSCRGSIAKAHSFSVAHEKVIVIDDEWVFVQSGNFSPASTPANEGDGGTPPEYHAGNRDMGVAIQSVPLAQLFTTVLIGDIKRELDAEGLLAGLGGEGDALQPTPVLLAATAARPPKLFPSERFTPESPVNVQPVLTPDNYVDVIAPRLREAKSRIRIEQQYIRAAEPGVSKLCDAIAYAREKNPKLDIQIILAPPFGSTVFAGSDVEADLQALSAKYGLTLGKQVRLLNHKYFMHLHNKLVIIDDVTVLVSSQNWSDPAVSSNREAGLLIDSERLAKYFNQIVDLDWETGVQTPDDLTQLVINPPAIAAAGAGETGVIPVALTSSDYDNV